MGIKSSVKRSHNFTEIKLQFKANRSRNTEAQLPTLQSKMKILIKWIGKKSPDFPTFKIDKFRIRLRSLPAYVHVLLRRKHLRCVDATVAEPVTLTAMVKTLGPAVESDAAPRCV